MKIEVNGYVLEVPDDFNDEQIGKAVDEFAGEMGFTPESQDTEVDGMPTLPTVQTPAEPTPHTQLDTGWLGRKLGMDVAVPTEEAVKIDKTPEQVAADLRQANPAMTQDDAMAKALTQHRQVAAKDAINLGAMMIPGAKPLQLATAGLFAGGGGEVASQAIETFTDPNAPDRSLTDRASDVVWEGGKDAAINVTAGVVGGKVVNKLEDTYRWIKGLAPKGMDDLSRAGNEASEKIDAYRSEYSKIKAGEAETMAKQDMIYGKQKATYDADVAELPAREAAYAAEVARVREMVAMGTLTRRQADAVIAEIPTPKVPVEPVKADFEPLYGKTHDAFESKYLDDTLESIPGVTARDIFDAEAKAAALGGEFKVGTGTLSEQVDNFTLSQELRKQALPRELDDAKAFGFIPMSKKMQEVTGLRDPDLYRVRDKAVKSELGSVMDKLAEMRKGSSSKLDSVLDDLEGATAKVFQGSSKEADVLLNSAKSKTTNRLDLEENSAANAVRRQIDALSKIKTNATSSSRAESDSLLTALSKSAAGGAVGGSIYGFQNEGQTQASDVVISAIVGAALGAGARKTAGKISQSGINNRREQVKAALGGKYKIDDTALQMIENGADIGKVITYIVIADMRAKDGDMM